MSNKKRLCHHIFPRQTCRHKTRIQRPGDPSGLFECTCSACLSSIGGKKKRCKRIQAHSMRGMTILLFACSISFLCAFNRSTCHLPLPVLMDKMLDRGEKYLGYVYGETGTNSQTDRQTVSRCGWTFLSSSIHLSTQPRHFKL
jgi:hypothetical protein